MDAPEARYLERDGAALAYQVVGEHGVDILFVGDGAQHFDLAWTDPHFHDLFERSATYSRTIYLQLRGFGLSGPVDHTPTIEQFADDIVAVLDEVGMQQATLVGNITTCAAVALVAARHPHRVSGLVLYKPLVCGPLAANAAKHAWTAESATEYVSRWRAAIGRWGSGSALDAFDPVLATPYNRRLMATLERCSARPAAVLAYAEAAFVVDFSAVLPAVQAPTRVLHTPTGLEPEPVVRRVAELIPNATFHSLPPTQPGAAMGESFEPVFAHTRELASGGRPGGVDAGRFLGTVLFTDIVGSTELLARMGDAEYRDKRAAYERQVRLHVDESGGRLVNVIGDGTLSLFDGPARAVRCAKEICRSVRDLDISVRTGVHTGEMEHTRHDVTGLAVHIGARIGALAGAGEVLVSQTVHDLVAGSGLSFAARGERELRGVPGLWQVFSLAADAPDLSTAADRTLETALDRATLRTARAAPWAMRAALRVGNAVQRRRARIASS